MELTGRSAIVTGGSKGIGYAVAALLARAGADVAICARSADDVSGAVAALDGLGPGRVLGVRCDMRVEGDVRRLVERVAEEMGRIDVLVNNAGVGRFAPMDELSSDAWHAVIETNLNGVFYASSAVIPLMKRAGSGFIINIGSLAGKNPIPGGAAYNASKFGLLGFSEAMMLDVRQFGIRVTCIMPGSVSTHFNEHTPGPDDVWKIQPEDIARIVMDLLSMPERTLPSRIEVRPSKPPRR
jgi:3-oxoacyl-[acyl-carrier protein] reductase